MARKFLMTWQPDKRRWRKRFRGTWYFVTCADLGTPATKEDSWRAANNWWTRRHVELLGKPALDANSSQVQGLIEAVPVHQLRCLVEKGQAAEQLLWMLQLQADDRNPETMAKALAGGQGIDIDYLGYVLGLDPVDDPDGLPRHPDPQQVQVKLTELAETVAPQVPTDRSLKAAAERWKSLTKGSNARRLADARMLAYFTEFLGDVEANAVTEKAWEDFFVSVKDRELDDGYKARIMATARRFVGYLFETKLLEDLPRNIGAALLSFKTPVKAVEPVSGEAVRAFYKKARGQTRLHMLLGLNCGMLAKDMSDLQDHEVDWQSGIVTRRRSKTAHHTKVPLVTYKLWPKTFALLRKYRSGRPTVLLTQTGNPWIREVPGKGRSDSISSTFRATCKRAGVKVAPSDLRTAAADMLGRHPQFKFYTETFLGHSPRTVTERHYQRPSEEEFAAALAWLEQQFPLF